MNSKQTLSTTERQELYDLRHTVERPLTPTMLDRDPNRVLSEEEAEQAIQAFERRCQRRTAALEAEQ